MLLLSTIYAVQAVPAAQANNQQFAALTTKLESLHITRFYTDYWTCNRAIFATEEQLICGVIEAHEGTLTHGWDRYLPYQQILKATPNPAFVYPETGNNDLHTLLSLLAQQHIPYLRIDTAGFAIFMLARPLQNTKL